MSDTAPEPAADPDRMPRWVPRAIALFFAMAVGLYVLAWIVRELRGLLILILVSLFLSFALEPAVNRLERMGFRRSLGTLIVFAVSAVALTLFGWAIGTVVADQFGTFVDEAPGYIEEVQLWASETLGIELDTDALVSEFQAGGAATELATRLAGNLVDLGTTALSLLLQIFTVGLFTFYLVADGPRLRRAVLSIVAADRQAQVLATWELAIDKTGGYLYSRGLLALASFVVHFIGFTLIGVPFPLALALWVGVMSQFIPVIGTYLAGALPILIALLNSPTDAIWVAIVVAGLPAGRELHPGPAHHRAHDGRPPGRGVRIGTRRRRVARCGRSAAGATRGGGTPGVRVDDSRGARPASRGRRRRRQPGAPPLPATADSDATMGPSREARPHRGVALVWRRQVRGTR